jgi:hypothetical protein
MVFALPTSHAALIWPKTEHTIQTTPTDPEITLTFEAINTDDTPIEITQIEKTCGCTKATATKTTLQKGEETKLNVVITPPPSGGKQDKHITVKTSDGKTQILTIHLQMPETFTLSAPTEEWADTLDEKALTVQLKQDTKFLTAESLTPDFQVTNQQRSPEQILIKIKPTPRSRQENLTPGTLRLQFALKGKPFYHYIPLRARTSEQPEQPPLPNSTKSERAKYLQTEIQKLQFRMMTLTQELVELTKTSEKEGSK